MSKPRRARSSLSTVAWVGIAWVGAAALPVILGAGCEKKPAPGVAPAPRGMPPLDPSSAPQPGALPRAMHAPSDPTGMPPGHPPMPAGHGGAMANPHDDPKALEAASPGEIPFDPKTVVAGLIKLDGKLKDKVKNGDVIYLVARGPGEGGAPGPVVAVKRMEAAAFPMKFTLDSRDAMMVGTQMKGPLVITARVDKDGDAMTKNPGDVVGTLDVKALPAPSLSLVLDKVL